MKNGKDTVIEKRVKQKRSLTFLHTNSLGLYSLRHGAVRVRIISGWIGEVQKELYWESEKFVVQKGNTGTCKPM